MRKFILVLLLASAIFLQGCEVIGIAAGAFATYQIIKNSK